MENFMENIADLYSDYLITYSSYTTATGMGSLLSVKHDKITRALTMGDYDSKFVLQTAKVYVQELT
jgi:hypothetical protein